MGALHKLQLTPSLWFQPYAVRHFVSGQTVAGAVRFRQVHKGADSRRQWLQLLQDLLPQVGCESGSYAFHVIKLIAAILTHNDGREGVVARDVATDDKFGLAVEAMLLP